MDKNGEFYIKDNIIIDRTQLRSYINQHLSSLNEIKNIFNKSTDKLSQECIELIFTDVKSKLFELSKNPKINEFKNILPELFLLNRVKLDLEIETGILFCDKCKRWYPIIETIPQMLPDRYRKEKDELEFLESNKNLLDDEFLNQDLKPFKI